MSEFEEDKELLDTYIYEQTTLLESLNEIVLHSEEEKHFSREDLEEIFRIMHTVKGSAAMMEYEALSHTAHLAEELFSRLQKNQPLKKSKEENEVFDCVFSVLDYFQRVLEEVQSGNDQLSVENELNERLCRITEQLMEGTSAKDGKIRGVQPEKEVMEKKNSVRIYFKDCKLVSVRALVIQKKLLKICETSRFEPENLEEAEKTQDILTKEGMLWYFDDVKDSEKIMETALKMLDKQPYVEKTEAEKIEKAENTEETEDDGKKENFTKSRVLENSEQNPVLEEKKQNDRRIRTKSKMISVSQEKVTSLMDITGEMITMLSRMEDIVMKTEQEETERVLEQMKKKSAEMQEAVLALNLVTVEGLFQKVRRIVREMTQKLEKEVFLVFEGSKTEIDKNTVERLSNPLLHLIRNAFDHGIEPAEERKKLGKTEKGTIRVEARNLGREVQISISDDGCGLNRKKILKKAKEKNMLTKNEEDYLDKEVYQMIMKPNFSTNDTISEYSGRGVGMNVVLEELEKINGTIQIESQEGTGTSFILKIPMSLAIVEGMDVRAGKYQFAMQSSSVKQIFAMNSFVNVIERNPMCPEILIKDRIYPLVNLSRKFQEESKEETPYEKGIMILLESSRGDCCIFVDEVVKIRQMVVKKLPVFLENKIKGSRLYCGCTILGNGDVSLILDSNHLI